MKQEILGFGLHGCPSTMNGFRTPQKAPLFVQFTYLWGEVKNFWSVDPSGLLEKYNRSKGKREKA